MRRPLNINISDLATTQIRAAEDWWRLNRTKAPNAIREELERAASVISVQPEAGARALNVSLADVRRLHLARIRYYVYYWLLTDPERIGSLPSGIFAVVAAHQPMMVATTASEAPRPTSMPQVVEPALDTRLCFRALPGRLELAGRLLLVVGLRVLASARSPPNRNVRSGRRRAHLSRSGKFVAQFFSDATAVSSSRITCAPNPTLAGV